MTARRHQGDVLILGASLEAALMAALVARRGCKILWLGGAPEATVPLGKIRVPAAPGLVPAFSHAPALTKALREIGLLAEIQRTCKPTSLQYLGERLRISLPTDWLRAPDGQAALQALQESAGIADELASAPLRLRWFGRRQYVQRRAAIVSRAAAPSGMVGEASDHLDGIFGRCSDSAPATYQVAAAPNDFTGGTLALGQMLQKRCADHHARLFPQGLRQPLQRLDVTFRGVEGALATGETLAAHMLVVCLDQSALSAILPQPARWARRVPTIGGRALLRLSLHVRRRGVPEALGAFALLRGEKPLWLERRKADDESETLSLFWRSDGSDVAAQGGHARKRLEGIAPFLERHVIATAAPEAVPDHDALERLPDPLLSRRLFFGRGPLLSSPGLEGAAIMAHALAERALKLSGRAPSPDQLAGSSAFSLM